MDISFFSKKLLEQRTELLQKNLRPMKSAYPINSEYPIVLSVNNNKFSICVTKSSESHRQKLIAHANIWPRTLVNSKTNIETKIALIGNVATNQSYQGQGIMRKLFTHLSTYSIELGCEALLLWSNLYEFYHKLGFQPRGKELRIFFTYSNLRSIQNDYHFDYVNPDLLSDYEILNILSLRYPSSFFIKRTVDEFRILLKIPDTTLLICCKKNQIIGFCIIGKGNDMIGMVHEWGATHPEIIAKGLKHILDITKSTKIGLLTPKYLDLQWYKYFSDLSHEIEEHPMTLVKPLQHDTQIIQNLEKAFIWGLDSI